MNREQLEHVLRAAAAIAQENSLVVLGSQAVLLPFPDAPQALLASREVDLYPALHPERADLIDGAIGAMSSFDETFGYYADGVGPETAVMPADWMDRARLYYIGDVTAICPDIHDLAVSNVWPPETRMRTSCECCSRKKMIDPDTLDERIRMLDAAAHPLEAIRAWARRRDAEARS